MITVTALFELIVWFAFKYSSKVEIAKTLHSEDSDLNGIAYTLDIYFYESIFKQQAPVSLLLHLIFVVLGFVNPIAHTFHLFMIIFFNRTA